MLVFFFFFVVVGSLSAKQVRRIWPWVRVAGWVRLLPVRRHLPVRYCLLRFWFGFCRSVSLQPDAGSFWRLGSLIRVG